MSQAYLRQVLILPQTRRYHVYPTLPHKLVITVSDQAQIMHILRWLSEYVGKFRYTWNYTLRTYSDWPKTFEFEFLREADCNMFGAVWQQSPQELYEH